MTFRVLTPYQVKAIEAPKPGKSRKASRGAKRKRTHSLSCYVPAGEGQSSRRVTGAHLEPDSPEMMSAAMVFASGLLEATQQGVGMTRSLIGPARYGDKVLAHYCSHLIKGALGKPNPALRHPVSPVLVPYLLGGCTWTQIENAGQRAMELMDFFGDPNGVPMLHRAISNVGFGEHVRHRHYDTVIKYDADNVAYPAEVEKKHSHLSYRQDYLLNLPRDSGYAVLLVNNGAYDEGLRRLLASWKPEIIAEAERELDPAGGEMSEIAGAERCWVKATDYDFQQAVTAVFERPWDQLDLKAGGQENATADMQVLLARKIIHRLSYNDKATAEHLIGMSLLTGISVANWVNFAIEDRERRGETFITGDEVERIIDLVQAHPAYGCDDELRAALLQFRYEPERMEAKRRFARRLQSARNPLWSTNGLYYQRGFESQTGAPICKPKPFQPNRSDVD